MTREQKQSARDVILLAKFNNCVKEFSGLSIGEAGNLIQALTNVINAQQLNFNSNVNSTGTNKGINPSGGEQGDVSGENSGAEKGNGGAEPVA